MSIYNGTITQGGAPQYVVDPNTASASIAFLNQSNDRLVFAYNGADASPTNGVLLPANVSLYITRTGAAIGGLRFPWGAVSVYGPTSGAAYQVLIDQ